MPDPEEIEALITKRTRAIVVINPNNPTGAVYPRAVLEAIARIAEKHHLVVFADEIYDQMTYDDAEFVPMATLVHHTLCAHAERPLEGLSRLRLPRRLGGLLRRPGDMRASTCAALELLSSLRLCSNVAGQWAVQTALGGYQSIRELVAPGGRLYESRKAIVEAVGRSRYLTLTAPMGALYAFVGVDTTRVPGFDDQRFAMDLLEHKHVLVAPGTSFNVPYNTHFRVTNLPEPDVLRDVFGRMEELLDNYASGDDPISRPSPLRAVESARR